MRTTQKILRSFAGVLVMSVIMAIVLLLSVGHSAHAQDAAPAATDTCAGVTVSGTQETVNRALRALGCTYVAPRTPSGIGQDNTCRVVSPANIRKGPGTNYAITGSGATNQRLSVVGHNTSGTWTQTSLGWIRSPLCQMVPDTIETAPRSCNAYLRADGFQMDWALDENGTKYDVTILNTAPINPDGSRDLCWAYRTIQDGAESSIINDLLPQPPGSRGDAPEFTDFTLLADDWANVEYAYYSGVAGKLLWDPDKSGPRGLEAVLDVNGQPVQFSENGTQFFEVAPYVGAWMSWQCVENCPFHWGFRIDRKPWSRP